MSKVDSHTLYLLAFDILVAGTYTDVTEAATELHTQTIKVLESVADYRTILLKTKDRSDDIAKVIAVIEGPLNDEELDVTKRFLVVLKDLADNVPQTKMVLGLELGLIGASQEVIEHSSNLVPRWKSDIARRYIETVERIFDTLTSGKFYTEDEQVSQKKQLAGPTTMVLHDLDAYKEVMSWARGEYKDVVLQMLLHIGVFSEEDFYQVDTLAQILLNVRDSRQLLTTSDMQTILETIGASAAVIRYDAY